MIVMSCAVIMFVHVVPPESEDAGSTVSSVWFDEQLPFKQIRTVPVRCEALS